MLELSFDGWKGVRWADMEEKGVLKRRTSEPRCVGGFKDIERVVCLEWREMGDVLADETEEAGKGQIMKGLAFPVNVDFLLKVIWSHWRMLNTELAWSILYFRHISGGQCEKWIGEDCSRTRRSVQESPFCWKAPFASQASFPDRRQHGSFLNGTGQVSVKTGTDPSLLIKIHN